MGVKVGAVLGAPVGLGGSVGVEVIGELVGISVL